MQNYSISSRDYLRRAKEQLATGLPSSLFYAALELRCGIESRMNEYLNAWDHIAKKKKNGWNIVEIGRNIESEFQLGAKIVRWAIHEEPTGKLLVVFYYTPVTPRLRKAGEKLGGYLHSMKTYRSEEDSWWQSFRELLNSTASDLEVANRGTMLGPALLKRSTKQAYMNIEVLPTLDPGAPIRQTIGVASRVKVDYLDALPEPLESEAQIWDGLSST